LGLENSEDDRKKDGTVPMATKINGL
jgi:hypothetical protein